MTSVSTSSFYDRSAAAMDALSQQADRINTQISSTKRLSAASDDVVAYQRLRGIAAADADGTADAANVKIAQGVLGSADTTLGAIQTQLQQASALVVQARNGTLTSAQRATIGEQIVGIAQSIASLGATTDPRGVPLFGGADGGPAVTVNADGTHSLASGEPAAIPIGGGQSVQLSESASRVFALPDGRNTIDMLASLAGALGDGAASDADLGDAITDISQATDQVSSVQGSIGARAARVDLQATQLSNAATDRESARSSLEDTDVTAAITELQKTQTVLQATQASFTKLSSLSLFDYLK